MNRSDVSDYVVQEKDYESLKERSNGMTVMNETMDLSYLRSLSRDEYDSKLDQYKQLIIYAERYAYMCISPSAGARISFAIFTRDNVLLYLFVSDGMRELMDELHIKENTIWSQSALGYNAVSAGLETNKSCMSEGAEHYNESLRRLSICYSPLVINTNNSEEITEYGGIAVMIPAEASDPTYRTIAHSLAFYIISNIFSHQTKEYLYEKDPECIIEVDKEAGSDSGTLITYMSNSAKKMFMVRGREYTLSDLSGIIDPPPENRLFWDIVDANRNVRNVDMTLVSRGIKHEVTVSTKAHYMRRIGFRGMVIFITTPEIESSSISYRMGNNAIMSVEDIKGKSLAIDQCRRRAMQIAQISSNVLIYGESGVGKDIFAQAIHNASDRASKPFIAVNCGALPRELIASELFGYDPGAFTGAKRQGNIGKFELANGGTIFLDEIGELPLDLQATLLRVVEDNKLMRVGGTKYIDIDVRIISATNAQLNSMMESKTFRSDLYYRLAAVEMYVPPLRSRKDDIIPLAEYFIERTAEKMGSFAVPVLSEDARTYLMNYSWPGNVRELQNILEAATQLCEGNEITRPMIDYRSGQDHIYEKTQPPEQEYPDKDFSYENLYARKDLSREELLAALKKCAGNKTAAARMLGISVRTIYRKLEKYGIPF